MSSQGQASGLMNVFYYLTISPPAMPECDAVVQEVEALRKHFGGSLVYVNPNRRLPVRLPRMFFGLHQLGQLRSREASAHLHHLFNPDPFPFPILCSLRRPIIYSLTGGITKRRPNVDFLASLAAVTVADERSLERLKSWGVDNAVLVRPGIDTSRFTCSLLPLRSEIKLMVGSAPWTLSQFRSKGIEALLSVAQRFPQLYLVFLWRGILVDELERRVRRMHLEGRVEILNRKVDVNEVLAGVHASVTLATDPAIIRPWPHSLMESLAAGKPVIVSRCIPMADYVQQTGCGQVVERVTPTDLLSAIEALARKYDELQQAARRVGQQDFSQQNMINSYRLVYEHILESTNPS
jgi:glycosyltransferase involved in cell wall biosynthesis